MALPDHVREPCPYRIVDDVGGAFSMGAVGGSIFHFLRGSKNSPKGERIVGGIQAVRSNAPRIGGSFAVWGGLFSTFDCMLVYVRQKEDPWNSIAAGAATGGFLQMRSGLNSATRAAIFGGVILALIEGAGLMLNRLSRPPQPPLIEPIPSGYSGNPQANRGNQAGFSGVIPKAYGNEVPTSRMLAEKTPNAAKKGWFTGWWGSQNEAEGQTSSQPEGLDLSTSTHLSGFQERTSSVHETDSELHYPQIEQGRQKIKSQTESSWFGGLLGSKKQENIATDSFEAPPVPNFEIK